MGKFFRADDRVWQGRRGVRYLLEVLFIGNRLFEIGIGGEGGALPVSGEGYAHYSTLETKEKKTISR